MIKETKLEAWTAAERILKTDYFLSAISSERAGYPIYRSTEEGCNDYICDLGDRLEVNIGNQSINIWAADVLEAAKKEEFLRDEINAVKRAIKEKTAELDALKLQLYGIA